MSRSRRWNRRSRCASSLASGSTSRSSRAPRGRWRRACGDIDAGRPVAAGPAGAIGLQLRARVSVRRARYGAGAAARLSGRDSAAAVAGADGGMRLHHDALNHRRMLPGQRAALWPPAFPWCCIRSMTAGAHDGTSGRRRSGHHRSRRPGAGVPGASTDRVLITAASAPGSAVRRPCRGADRFAATDQ